MGVKIALYGGIGSGKSTAADIIRSLGIRVADCDRVYREHVLSDSNYRDMLVVRYGADIVKGGAIDTRALGKIVYADRTEKAWLDSVAHPLIMELTLSQISDCDLAFAEVPLLYEGGFRDMFDAAALVTCSLEKRIDRLVKDRYAGEGGESYVRKAAAAQASDEQLKSIADYVIDNNGSREQLRTQIEALIGEIKARFNIADRR